jgi:hypothetical protein
MRCDCCDTNLSDYESTLRLVSTGDFANICLKCLEGLDIEVKGNQTLKRKKDANVEEYSGDLSEELQSLVQEQRADRLQDEN